MKRVSVIRGHFVYTQSAKGFMVHENGFLVSVDGVVEGIYDAVPEKYEGCFVEDWGDRLIVPGFVDLHLHGAQFLQCGMGMNKKLLEWLNDYTFDLEKSFKDPDFAKEAYTCFAESLVASGTLRACVFASSSTEGTVELFEALKKVGIGAFAGKVNMDCNAPDFIIETTEDSLAGTRMLLEKYGDEPLVKPIITPRFAPTSTRKLLKGLGDLAAEYGAAVQSHLNESIEEIEWVKSLFPEAESYTDLYERNGLFGNTPTVMAHCIHMPPEELSAAKKKGVFMVHCPDSNINVRSGVMPVKSYLEQGLNIGLGSDVAGGHKIGMNEAMVRAIQLSKISSMESGDEYLSLSEVFYMATRGGGAFFGNTGSFEKGFKFDALVLEDNKMISERYGVLDRLEKYIYTGDDRNIVCRYVEGVKI